MSSEQRNYPFDPDWTIAPGVTLEEWIKENGLSVRVVARMCSMEPDQLQRVIDGKRQISNVVACKLQQGTQIPARFWLNYERSYRAALAAGKKGVTEESRS